MNIDHFRIGSQSLSAVANIPDRAGCIIILAHGAGAGMMHHGMEAIAESLYDEGIGTLRFNFPYMELGRKAPGSPKQAMQAIVEVVEFCSASYPEYQIIAGGKSYGGRMTSTAAAEGLLPGIKGVVFYGFPLHAPGKPSDHRAAHLYQVNRPMLFLQGTRDKLADLELLGPVVQSIKAEMMILEGADHSFNVLKSNPKTKEELLKSMAQKVTNWISSITV